MYFLCINAGSLGCEDGKVFMDDGESILKAINNQVKNCTCDRKRFSCVLLDDAGVYQPASMAWHNPANT